jgi:signal transduction histidine kinase
MNTLPTDLKKKRWYQEFEFEDAEKQADFEQYVSTGTIKPLKVALLVIAAFALLTILRDISFPTSEPTAVLKQLLRALIVALSLFAYTSIKFTKVISPRSQVFIASAVAIVTATLSWAVIAVPGVIPTEELLGRYVTITAILMIALSTIIRCHSAVTVALLCLLAISPSSLALPIAQEFPAANFRNAIFIASSFALGLYLHFSIKTRELLLFESIWEAKQHLRRSNNANRSKRIFFTAIAHDYRQPLSALQTYIDLAVTMQEQRQFQQLPEILRKIQNSTANINENLHDLLQVSTMDAATDQPTIESVDLNALASKMIDLYEPSAIQKGVAR